MPRGTYKGPHTYVGVNKIGNKHLVIYDIETNKELAQFEIPDTKGNLVRNNNHKRDNSQRIIPLMKRVAEKFPDSEKAQAFFEEIQKEKPRYIRDQLTLIETSIESINSMSIGKALD